MRRTLKYVGDRRDVANGVVGSPCNILDISLVHNNYVLQTSWFMATLTEIYLSRIIALGAILTIRLCSDRAVDVSFGLFVDCS